YTSIGKRSAIVRAEGPTHLSATEIRSGTNETVLEESHFWVCDDLPRAVTLGLHISLGPEYSWRFRTHTDREPGARDRHRCLHLLLSPRDDGHHPEAVHEHRSRQRVRQRPDEYVREHPGLSTRRFQGSRALELRHALFHCVARSHQGAVDCLRARHRWALLPPPNARHVDGRFRFAGLAHDGNTGGQFPCHSAGLDRDGPDPIHPD